MKKRIFPHADDGPFPGCLPMMLIAIALWIGLPGAAMPQPPALATVPPSLAWLRTDAGQLRGLVLDCDLRDAATRWALWGPAPGAAPLNRLPDLPPADALGRITFAVNGGYWNEFDHPVGVCAGEQGIFADRSHPAGFAIAGETAWIGPLQATVSLAACALDATTEPLHLNPRPLLVRSAYLIDPGTWPGPLALAGPAEVVWLDLETTGPLRFNTRREGTAGRIEQVEAGVVIPRPQTGTLLWIRPDSAADGPPISPGSRWRVTLRLNPLSEPVRLATCGGPLLLNEGAVVEGLDARLAWRTAVGVDRTGHRLWVVALARSNNGLFGVTLIETAQTLKALGADRAINLDGGSSTSVLLPSDEPALTTLFPLRRPIHHGLFMTGPLSSSE